MPAQFVIYARKSSESEDKQVLSIGSQIQELRDHAARAGLAVSEILSESRSAKAPGRPVFAQLMRVVEQRKTAGILCWKLDRLARNPVDGGALIWALDRHVLSEIATPNRTFSDRGDDKFWMQLEFGMAKKYVDDLSENVKRGNRTKLLQGWFTGLPPLGYINDVLTHTILPDPERFDLIRRVWDLALIRTPIERILNTVNTEWGFRTRKSKRQGGRPMAESSLYRLLSNSFYYGLIVRKGEVYPGAHKTMISRDEFDRVQEFLGRPNRAAPKRHSFPFTGLIHCGECGLSITAEHKTNRHGHRYTYYHCTKRRVMGTRCTQASVRAEEIENQARTILQGFRISPRALKWASAHLSELRTAEESDRKRNQTTVESAIKDCDTRLSRLTDLRLQDLIPNEEYVVKRQQIVEEKLGLTARLNRPIGEDGPAWFEPAKHYFSFLAFAEKEFTRGDEVTKREILQTLGSNLTLKDGTLRIQAQKPLLFAEAGHCRSSWQALVESVRTFFTEHPDSLRWPRFCHEVADHPSHSL